MIWIFLNSYCMKYSAWNFHSMNCNPILKFQKNKYLSLVHSITVGLLQYKCILKLLDKNQMDWSCKYRWSAGELELGGLSAVTDTHYSNCSYFHLTIKIHCQNYSQSELYCAKWNDTMHRITAEFAVVIRGTIFCWLCR